MTLDPRITLVARYAMALLAIAITVHLIDFGDVVSALTGADPLWVTGGIAGGFAIWLVNTWKWQLLIRARTAPPRLWTLYRLNMVSALYGTILPGQIAGEAVKVLRVARSERDRGILVASIAVDRISGLLGLLGIGVVGALATDAPTSMLVALAIAAIGAIVVTAWLLRSRTGAADLAGPGRLAALRRKLGRLADAIAGYRSHPRALMGALALSCAFQLGLTVIVWGFGQALGVNVGIAEMAWVVAAVSVVQLLPITIASIGTREGAFIVLLGMIGVARADALALSLLLLVSNVSLALAGALSEIAPQQHVDANRRAA